MERGGGHPAGCRGREQGAAGTSTTSRDRDRAGGVWGGAGGRAGTSLLRAEGCGGLQWRQRCHHPCEAPRRGAAPCPHPRPMLLSWGERCVPLPQRAQSHKRCPTSCPAPAAPELSQSPMSRLQRTRVCPKPWPSTPLPPSPAWASVAAQGPMRLDMLLAGPGHPCPPGGSHGQQQCHPSLGTVPGLPLSRPSQTGCGGYWRSIPPNTRGCGARPPASTARGGLQHSVSPADTIGGGQGVGQSSPKVPSLLQAPLTHVRAAPGPHGTIPHGAGDTGGGSRPCKGWRRGWGGGCTPAPSRHPMRRPWGDPALLPLPLRPDPTAKG